MYSFEYVSKKEHDLHPPTALKTPYWSKPFNTTGTLFSPNASLVPSIIADHGGKISHKSKLVDDTDKQSTNAQNDKLWYHLSPKIILRRAPGDETCRYCASSKIKCRFALWSQSRRFYRRRIASVKFTLDGSHWSNSRLDEWLLILILGIFYAF